MAYDVISAQHNPSCSKQRLKMSNHLLKVCILERAVAAEAQQLLSEAGA